MEQVFRDVAEKCRKANFIETVIEKAHYAPEDRELLWSVLEKILACMEDGAAVSDREALREMEVAEADGETGTELPCKLAREVVMTLGKGVDELQDQFLADGALTEAYMVEVLGSEILLLAYTAYNAWIAENTDVVVKRYHFLGMGEYVTIEENMDGKRVDEAEDAIKIPLGLSALPGMLERSRLPVTCTEGYCMIPKKSVAFYAELTNDKSVTCEGICTGCGRTDCPNRMAVGNHTQGNKTLDRPLTYGYARILGLFS